jgi:hypothetical protein
VAAAAAADLACAEEMVAGSACEEPADGVEATPMMFEFADVAASEKDDAAAPFSVAVGACCA